MTPAGCCGSGGATHLVGEVQGGAGAADGGHHQQVPVLAGDVQWRVAVPVLLVGVAAAPQQAADHLHLAPPHRQVQGRVTVLTRTGKAAEIETQKTNGRGAVTFSSSVQGLFDSR